MHKVKGTKKVSWPNSTNENEKNSFSMPANKYQNSVCELHNTSSASNVPRTEYIKTLSCTDDKTLIDAKPECKCKQKRDGTYEIRMMLFQSLGRFRVAIVAVVR